MLRTSLKRYPVKLLAIAVLLLSGCAAKKPVEGRPWATYLNNESRGNFSPGNVTLPAEELWDKDVSDFKIFRSFPKEQLSAPVLSDSVLYAASTDEALYSYDLYTGKSRWDFDAERPLDAAPSVAEGLVCFGSSDGVLRCLDNEGKELFRFQARSEILSSPVIAEDRIIFSSSDDRVHAISAKDGAKLWTYGRGTFQTVAPRIYSSPAYSGGKIYQLFSDGNLACISAENGKELWVKKIVKNFDGADKTRRTPLIDDGTVYAIDENGAIQALSTETGDVKGLYNIIPARDFVIKDGRTLIIAGSDQLVALDRLTGAIGWKKEIQFSPVSSVFAAGENLFVLSNYEHVRFGWKWLSKIKGRVQAFRLKDGEYVWGAELKSPISSNGAAGGDTIALLTDEGYIEVFGAK